MTEAIRAYINSLETGEPHTADEWREIINAEQDDFERQDERFTRLTEQEIREVVDTLDNDGFVIQEKSVTIMIATGNWFDDGSIEYGKSIEIKYSDDKSLSEALDTLTEEEYRNAYIDDLPIREWLAKHFYD